MNKYQFDLTLTTYHIPEQSTLHNFPSLVQNNYDCSIMSKVNAEPKVNDTQKIENFNDIVSGKFFGIEIKRHFDQIHFIICQSCFWCASELSPKIYANTAKITTIRNDNDTVTKCPSCLEGNLESIPIVLNEKYKFDHNGKRGVILKC